MRTKKRYPKAFNQYWENVEICGIMEEDDFKEEAYLAWKAGVAHGAKNGGIRKKRK